MKDKQLAKKVVKLLDDYDKDRIYGVQEVMKLIKQARQEGIEEGLNELNYFVSQSRWFVDDSDEVGPTKQTIVIAIEDVLLKISELKKKEGIK